MFIDYYLMYYLSTSEVKSLTTAIEEATSHALLAQFFNGADDISSLQSHNNALDQLINEATVSQLLIGVTNDLSLLP